MEGERSGQGFGSGMISFLVGALVGAGVGMLLAPKSGKDTREQIRGIAEELKETTEGYYERVRKTVVSALENGQELLDEKKDLVKSAVQAGIDTYEKKSKKRSKNAEDGVEPSPYG
jgi:gas vesicle protein